MNRHVAKNISHLARAGPGDLRTIKNHKPRENWVIMMILIMMIISANIY